MSQAKCKNCKQIIKSRHRHDFVQCRCRIASDQLSAKFREKLREYAIETGGLSEHVILCAFEATVGHGIFLDGGDDYYRTGGNLDDLEEIH